MRRAGLAFLLALWSFPVWAADECEEALTRPADSIVESAAASAAAVPANELKARLESAQKFRAFFGTVQRHLLERDDMLDMTELALLAKEHVLLMGPPGNAKSKLAKTVLSSMVEPQASDATKLVPSFYRIQMTPETTMSETHGPLDFKFLPIRVGKSASTTKACSCRVTSSSTRFSTRGRMRTATCWAS